MIGEAVDTPSRGLRRLPASNKSERIRMDLQLIELLSTRGIASQASHATRRATQFTTCDAWSLQLTRRDTAGWL
jgi:hypothetical protein